MEPKSSFSVKQLESLRNGDKKEENKKEEAKGRTKSWKTEKNFAQHNKTAFIH